MHKRKIWLSRLCTSLCIIVITGAFGLASDVCCPSAAAAQEARTWVACAGESGAGSSPSPRALLVGLGSTVVHLTVPGFFTSSRRVDGRDYSVVEIPGESWLRVPGKPMVPQVVLLVVCPECDGVEVSCRAEAQTVLEDVLLYPAPREVMIEDGGVPHLVEEFCIDGNAYAADEAYPQTAAQVLSVGRIRDQKVVWVGVYPVQYNAARRELSVAGEIEITLSYNNLTPSLARRGTGPLEDVCRRLLVGYDGAGEESTMRMLSSGGGQVVWAGDLEDCVDNETDYLIVAAERFCSGADSVVLESLADFRADSSGFNVSIVSIADIGATDTTLRDFIKDLYDSRSAAHWWDGHLGFVALVGDYKDPSGTVLIPRHLQPSESPLLPDLAADNWFASVAGDTLHPAVMLGRIPVDDGAELGNVVGKILGYEPLPDGPDWSKRVFLTAGTPDPENRAADSLLVSQVFGNLSAVIEGDGFDVSILRGDTLGPPYPDLTAMNADSLDRGWFFVNYAVHGDPCKMGYQPPRSFTACSVETLANEGMPCVFTAFGCQMGRFDTELTCGPCSTSSYDCVGERLVNIADAGAIAFVGQTDVGRSSQFNSMDIDLYEAVFGWHDPVLGMAFAEMLLKEDNALYVNRLVLLGDPALRIGYRAALRGKCDLWVRSDPELPPHVWFAPPIDTIPAPGTSALRVAIRNLTDVALNIPPASQAVAVEFRIHTWDDQWVLLGVDSVRTVGAWDSTTAEVTFHPLDYATGEYEFEVKVDPTDILDEVHEDNNIVPISEWVGFPPSQGTLPSVPSDEPTLAYLNDGPLWQHYVLFPCVNSWLCTADGGGHVSTALTFNAYDGALYSPGVGDLENDGRTLVVVSSQHKVSCVDLFMPDSSRVLWACDLGDTLVATPPCIVDLDGDNDLEVVVGAKTADGDSGFVVRLDGGAPLSPVTCLGERVPSCPLAATDLNNDGRYDIIVGTDKNYIVAIDGSDGGIFAENQVVSPDSDMVAVEGVAVGDLDFSGRAEIVAGGRRYLQTFAADTTLQSLKWGRLQKSAGISGIAIADVVDYADTMALEIVVSDVTSAGSARVSVYDAVHYGSLVSEDGLLFSGMDLVSVPIIGDLHTAPGAEIVFFTTDGNAVSSMRVWNATDSTIVSFLNDLAGPVASGALCDFDGDGLPQILFASSGDRRVWSATANGRATSIMWPTSLGDERGRNLYAVALRDTLPAADLRLWGRYTVAENVWFSKDHTLTLSPGTEIRFVPSEDDPPYFVCHGRLRAIGREEAPIVFTSADPTPSPGDWASLYLERNVGVSTSVRDSIEHCVLEYGTIGLDVGAGGGNSVTSVRSSCFRYNGTYGTNITREPIAASFDTLRVDDCEFLDNKVGGVHAHTGFLEVRHSNFVKDDSLHFAQTFGIIVERASAGSIIDNNYLNAGPNPPSDTSYWDYGIVLRGPWFWGDQIVRRNYIESFYQAGIEVSDIVAPVTVYVDSNCVRSGVTDSLPTTLVGMRFTEPLGRTTGAVHVRENAVYQTYLAVYASSDPLPILGDTSLFDGMNNLAGNTYYAQSASPDPSDTLKAEMCWWGDQPDSARFIGPVDYLPWSNMPSGTPDAEGLPGTPACALAQAYPNPLVAGQARIKYSLNAECNARIEVFNVLGQKVRCLQSGRLVPGPHEVFWDGTDENGKAIGAGVYFYRLETPHFRATKKMVVLN